MSGNPRVAASPGRLAGTSNPERADRQSDPSRTLDASFEGEPRFSRIRRLMKSSFATLALRPVPRERRLSVIERLDLGPKKSIWIVAYGERRFLVAGGADGLGTALEISPPDRPERLPMVWPVRWMEP